MSLFPFRLRTRFFLYSNVLILVTISIFTAIWIAHERRVHYDAIEHRGRSITEALAIPITDALMYEDLELVTETGLTDNYIGEILRRNRDLVRYIIVTDDDGVVTHSNRWQLLGESFPRALGRASIEAPPEPQRLTIDGERVLEVREPLNISTKFWGSLVIGYSLESVDREVSAVARRAILLALGLILLNSLLTALYVRSLFRPLMRLHGTMRRASRGDLDVRVPAGKGDEVEEISMAFNRMMDELETVRARERLRSKNLAHTEKMAAVGMLAAGVAHEVNNPLGGILTCLENIKAAPDDREMLVRYMRLMEDGLHRIERTISNLLDFSRRREMRTEPTSINHNLRHVAELTAYQLRKKNVELVWDLDRDEPHVLADHFQMEQLFLNLYLNAAHAMPEGGTLTLRTWIDGDDVVAEVEDNGIGISPEKLDRIFDPFYTTRPVGEGTGLGLTVSDAIVSAHGGRVEVDSELGKGTTFRVILPLMKDESTRSRQEDS